MELFNPIVKMSLLGHSLKKSQIAHAVSPRIPEKLLNRKKTGFSVPIYQWLNPKASSRKNNHRLWAKLVYHEFTKSCASL